MDAAVMQGADSPIERNDGFSVLPKDTALGEDGAGFELPTIRSLDHLRHTWPLLLNKVQVKFIYMLCEVYSL